MGRACVITEKLTCRLGAPNAVNQMCSCVFRAICTFEFSLNLQKHFPTLDGSEHGRPTAFWIDKYLLTIKYTAAVLFLTVFTTLVAKTCSLCVYCQSLQ